MVYWSIMGIKLWLDDKRPAPEGWTHVYSVPEAFRLLKTGEVDEASFDHDLGELPCVRCKEMEDHVYPCKCGCHTAILDGSALVRMMAEFNVWPKTKPRIHSDNPRGVMYMRGVIDRYGPY